MKYFEVEFTLSPCSQDAQDILSAMAGEAGFETFEETEYGLIGYVQQELFDDQALGAVLSFFPIEGTQITYQVREAEDRDWNEQWEQKGFEPIVVDGQLVIHDGRHLPSHLSFLTSPLYIEIDAHFAFGTGTHETTRMICSTLLNIDLTDKSVLDCGCGTGILGICALKLGAANCTAYDIDEWSVNNTHHNAVINLVEQQMTILHGDATLLDSVTERFDVVMANINRNILLMDIERFVSVMASGATLILSGFYQNDCPLLVSKAQSLGLQLQSTRTDSDWACLIIHL